MKKHTIYQYKSSLEKRKKYLFFAFFSCIFFCVVVFPYIVSSFLSSGQLLSFSELLANNKFRWLFTMNSALIFVGYVSAHNRIKYGGHSVAKMADGVLLTSLYTQELEYKRYKNIVEELCVAANIHCPAIYVLPGKNINAFVAGYHLGDTVIAVNVGALYGLNKEELSALVAHELSHLVNEDYKQDMLLLKWTLTFSWVKDFGELIFTNLSKYREYISYTNRVLFTGFLSITVGAVIYFFGYILYLFIFILRATISKQREYLADAGSVFLTRNNGMSNVLRKALHDKKSNNKYHDKSSLEHMYTLNFDEGFAQLLNSHPSIESRIKHLNKGVLLSALPFYVPKSLISLVDIRKNMVDKKNIENKFQKDIDLALESPMGTQYLLSFLSGLGFAKSMIAFDMDFSGLETYDYQKKIQLIDRACESAAQWPVNEKRNFLQRVKKQAFSDQKICLTEYMWYSLFKHRLFPPVPSVQYTDIKTKDCFILFNLLNEFTLHDYFNASFTELCTHLDIKCEQYSLEKISLYDVDEAIKHIQEWHPLKKPLLTVSLAKHIQPHEHEALFWLHVLCVAIDSPYPRLS